VIILKADRHKEAEKQQMTRLKDGEGQLVAMLLLVTFALLFFTLPQYTRYIVYLFVSYKENALTYAFFVLIWNITNKLYYTNSAVNFFLYCISGTKFKSDLKSLFQGKF